MNLWVWFIWWQKCANRRKISLIRKHLTFDAAQLLDQALVTSKLGCCNLLLYDLPKVVIKHLQRVQNAAAGVTLSPKFCHITPVLANLPWLPTDLRTDFKILIVTYYSLHGLAPAYIQDLLQSYQRDFSKRIKRQHLTFSVDVRLSLARILRQVQWWSVSMVTRYDIISSRWSSQFEWKCMFFFQLFQQ